MPFSLAKELAQNTHRMARHCTFVAFPARGFHTVYPEHTEEICWNTESETYDAKVPPSRNYRNEGSKVGDSQLTALAFQQVFESRKETHRGQRAQNLHDKLESMLPNNNILVSVFDKNSAECPFLVGPNKGLALYMDPDLGDHVLILLTWVWIYFSWLTILLINNL